MKLDCYCFMRDPAFLLFFFAWGWHDNSCQCHLNDSFICVHQVSSCSNSALLTDWSVDVRWLVDRKNSRRENIFELLQCCGSLVPDKLLSVILKANRFGQVDLLIRMWFIVSVLKAETKQDHHVRAWRAETPWWSPLYSFRTNFYPGVCWDVLVRKQTSPLPLLTRKTSFFDWAFSWFCLHSFHFCQTNRAQRCFLVIVTLLIGCGQGRSMPERLNLKSRAVL